MTTKIVKNINHEVWTQFVCWCKIHNIRVGDKINEILEDYLKNG